MAHISNKIKGVSASNSLLPETQEIYWIYLITATYTLYAATMEEHGERYYKQLLIDDQSIGKNRTMVVPVQTAGGK